MSECLSHSAFPQPQRPITLKDLVVGVGATLIFFFTVLVVPLMGVFASILTPLPTLLGYYRWGKPVGYWIPVSAVVLSALVLVAMGLTQSMFYLIELLLLGLLTAKGMRCQWGISKIIAQASLAVFAVATVVFWVSHGGLHGSVFKGLETEVQSAMTALIQQYGPDTGQTAFVEQGFQRIVPFVVRLLPGLAAASIILICWLNLLMARHFCRIHRVALPGWPAWSHWKSPEILVWPLIAAGFMILLPVHWLRLSGFNLLIALGAIYLLHGLAIVAFFFDQWKMPGLIRGLGYGLIFLQQFVSLLIMLLGLFDIWLDLRRLSKPATPSDAS